DAATDDAMRFGVEHELGEAVFGAVGDGATGSRPRELRGFDLAPRLLGLILADADPGHFGVGIGDAGDYLDVEVRLLAGGRFGGDMTFMHRLVGEHGLADDIADGENVRHVGAHLRIDVDEAAVGDHHAGFARIDLVAVRGPSRSLQYQVVALRFGRRLFAFELDPDAVLLGFGRDCLGLQHDAVEAVGVLLLPGLDQIAVRALHQAVHHFDHIDAGAEGGIDG